jgi:hypothetical protein
LPQTGGTKMKKRVSLITTVFFVAILSVQAQNTEFVFQGQLQSTGTPANGSFDMEFALFDLVGGGSQIGSTLTRSGVAVSNGIFSVNLDFGSSFPGATRFLEIKVRAAGGGSFTTLSPRQVVTSSPYSIKSLNSDNAASAATATNATNAANAQNAVTFSGTLNGDVTGTQASTTVERLRGRTVSATQPSNGQVLKFNTGTSQWEPAADETGGGGGGGTITGVTAGTGLSGGGTTGSVTLNIAPGGIGPAELASNAVTTAKIADANVTNAKIADVEGSKITGSITTATIPGTNVTGTVANATNAVNATNATNFTGSLAGDVTGTQNTTAIAPNAVTTGKMADAAVTAAKIAQGQVVKGLNGLTDGVTLAQGNNITITPSGNTLTIAATGGGSGISGGGTTNRLPLFSGATSLGDSNVFQSGSNIGIGTPAPGSGLEVRGPGLASQQRITDTVSGNSLVLQGGSTSNMKVTGYNYNTLTPIPLFLSVDGANTYLNTGGGSVGIGTVAPTHTLDVNGFFRAKHPAGGNVVSETDGGVNAWAKLWMRTPVQSWSVGSSHNFNGNQLYFSNENQGGGIRMAIMPDGKVGIGTTNPGSRLDVFSAATTAVTGSSTSDVGVVGFSQNSVGVVGQTANPNSWAAVFGGKVRIDSLPTVSSFGSVCVDSGSTLIRCGASSLRWKTGVRPFRKGLDTVMRLRPISYEWKQGGQADFGLGAEDVARVAPDLAFTNEKGEVEGVKYERLSLYLINAVKEQQAIIERQQRSIRTLERRLTGLERSLRIRKRPQR